MEGITNRRLRLKFEDNTILTKTQKKLGLKRSWLLLKPHHHTISHLISEILDAFNLHHSCPHGILLTMDGFVLPPFESTIILKDKDLVSVKRKGLGAKALPEACPFIKDKLVEKQPLASAVKLLANEEFAKEARGYESETDADEVEVKEPVRSAGGGGGDVASKKRKASSPIEISKEKRLRQVSPKSVQKKDIDHSENIKSSQKKKKNAGDSKNEVAVNSTKNSVPRYEFNELDEKKEVTVHASGVPDGVKKVCRSTRRKMRQRKWRRVGRTNNNEENEKKHPMKDLAEVSGITKIVDANNEQPAEENSDADDNPVHVHIRPGHIRFASASKAKDVQKGQEANGWNIQPTQKRARGNHSAQKNVWDSNKNKAIKFSISQHGCIIKETFCWNGIKNKRKGQKWGKDNQPSSWKESRDYNGQSSNSRAIRNQPTPSWKQAKDHNTQISSTWASRRKQPTDPSLDFEKLLPLIDSPKVGDIVAYRLLELSSSWCPELSTFRVGKITSFDQETNNITLVPEAEYPLNLERKADDDDDYGQPPQPAVYNEDGSLEIDFPSLVDVRIVKTAKPSHSGGTGVPTANDTPGSSGMSKSTNEENGVKNGPSDTGNQELHTPTNPAKGKKDVWEEMSEALSAKKAQYLQEDTWNKKESSTTKRSWSHRTLRSSALGPTMPILRSRNGG